MDRRRCIAYVQRGNTAMSLGPGKYESGLSLIELMIALVIGSILMAGLIQVFSASRAAYQLSEGLARVQENGRFAVDYLQRDVRMAGHFGCVNDQAHARTNPSGMVTTFASSVADPRLAFDTSIQGYEADGTAPGAGPVAIAEAPEIGGVAYNPALPAEIANATANRIDGSDIVALRYLAPEGVPITEIAGTPSAPVFKFDAARWDVLRSGVTDPGLFGVTDCTHATVFQAATAGTDGNAGVIAVGAAENNVTPALSQVFTAGQATLYRAESVVYYVGLNSANRPSLFRVRFNAAPGTALTADRQELVEGIESLQLLYGQDRELDPARSPTGYIDRQGVAGAVEVSRTLPADGWRRVGSVQIGILAVSPDRSNAPQSDVTTNPVTALGVTFAPPNDGRYRTVYQTTVALRNRLYGN